MKKNAKMNTKLYPIKHIKSIYWKQMSDEAKDCGYDLMYGIGKAYDFTDDLAEIQELLHDAINYGLFQKAGQYAGRTNRIYMENQHQIIMMYVLDYLDYKLGYDVLTAWQWNEIIPTVRAYEGFYETKINDLMRDVQAILYEPCFGNEDYSVDTRGHVINNITGKELKPRDGGNGYLKVRLFGGTAGGRNATIHRLVARAFCSDYEDGLVVNHKDYDKHNNRASNLEWCTQRYNIEHAKARS